MDRKLDPELPARIRKLQKGDTSQLEPVLKATQARLYAFCFHLTGEPGHAEELAQEVYLRAFKTLAELPHPEGVFAWLFRIARNVRIDQTRTAESKLDGLTSRQDAESDEERVAGMEAGGASDAEKLQGYPGSQGGGTRGTIFRIDQPAGAKARAYASKSGSSKGSRSKSFGLIPSRAGLSRCFWRSWP